MLKRILSRGRGPSTPAPAVPPGTRVYAIGDVHGRLDALEALLALIATDEAERGPAAQTMLIFLGDLVDRGPDSAAVVERVRRLIGERADCHCLLGNHEEVFLAALAGSADALRFFSRFGGRETILSYGITPADYEAMSYEELGEALSRSVPPEHRTFLEGCEDLIVLGDYAFVHAGVRPGVPLSEQKVPDLRWIRSSFLTHKGGFEKVIVHGHTITEEVDFAPDRIGIDTGAYQSGRLTALGLEGTERWIMATDVSN